MVDRDFWRGKPILVTGHTGFKGGWLSTWLAEMGAAVTGLALAPDTDPSYFAQCGLPDHVRSILGDIRNKEEIAAALQKSRPEIVFHLAAQSLVRRSYREPVSTFATNVMGTVNLLDAIRQTPSVRAVVVVTSDKCYENHDQAGVPAERDRGYREEDPVGGRDPYSASKACAELVTVAYRQAFLEKSEPPIWAASARAGNVLGGGDWAEDRLVPDALRALERDETLRVRHPDSIRPWQHVLEPLSGYLLLAERLYQDGGKWAGAWNFGPREEDAMTVAALANVLIQAWGSGRWQPAPGPGEPLHEAGSLKLDSGKARRELGWQPRLNLEEAVRWTLAWHREAMRTRRTEERFRFSCGQIRQYEALGKVAQPC